MSARQQPSRGCGLRAAILLLGVAGALGAAASESDPPELEDARLAEYEAPGRKSLLALQVFRSSQTIEARDDSGRRGVATLTNLNPNVGAWLLVRLEWKGESRAATYHLENADPAGQRVRLDPEHPFGVAIGDAGGETRCDLWSRAPSGLARAAASARTFAPLCGGRLYLRNAVEGRKTKLEWTTDFLRDHVWRGEQITTFVRETFFQDAFLATSEVSAPEAPGPGGRENPVGAPARPLVDPRYDEHTLVASDLGLTLAKDAGRRLRVGRWYALRDSPGIFASAVQPRLVAPEVIARQAGRVNPLDPVESGAVVYLVAFDLARFELGYALGTEHPRLEWSDRVQESIRDPALRGPDGFADSEPLVRVGLLAPPHVERVAATFTGGFKRRHGGFRYSDLAARNRGSHYGFVEQGVVFSKLVPGLATLAVADTGEVSMGTWSETGPAALRHLRHARQNGVPLIEPDPQTGAPRPGDMVRHWGLGNWSGSQDSRFRTLRAGACLQERDGARFLIYGYFSAATPSAMARVFEAYDCRYAMLLDINALEHTYLAVYRVRDGEFTTQHLVEGMSVLDQRTGDQEFPRFVAFADNRDFFYLLRRDAR